MELDLVLDLDFEGSLELVVVCCFCSMKECWLLIMVQWPCFDLADFVLLFCMW